MVTKRIPVEKEVVIKLWGEMTKSTHHTKAFSQFGESLERGGKRFTLFALPFYPPFVGPDTV